MMKEEEEKKKNETKYCFRDVSAVSGLLAEEI